MIDYYKKCINQYELVEQLLKEYNEDYEVDKLKTSDLTTQMKTLIEYLHKYTQDLNIINGVIPNDIDSNELNKLIKLNENIKLLKNNMITSIKNNI
jgi:hypothetical protein